MAILPAVSLSLSLSLSPSIFLSFSRRETGITRKEEKKMECHFCLFPKDECLFLSRFFERVPFRRPLAHARHPWGGECNHAVLLSRKHEDK